MPMERSDITTGPLAGSRCISAVKSSEPQPSSANGKLPLLVDSSISIPSARVLRVLEELIEIHGKPSALRVDNGPELTSEAFVEWCRAQEIEIRYIQPGKPARG